MSLNFTVSLLIQKSHIYLYKIGLVGTSIEDCWRALLSANFNSTKNGSPKRFYLVMELRRKRV